MRDFTINQRDVFTIILFNLFSCRLVSASSGLSSRVSALRSLRIPVWFVLPLPLSHLLACLLCVSIVINCVALCVCVCVCALVCVGQLERSAGFYVVVGGGGGVGNNETVFRYEHRECVAKYAKRLRIDIDWIGGSLDRQGWTMLAS